MASTKIREKDLEAEHWKRRELAGFIDVAGPLWTRRVENGWVYGFLTASRHLNPAGVVHGGVLVTLMDHALSTVAWEASGRVPCMTLQLDTHFMAAVHEGQLVEARAEITQRTQGLFFMRGDLTVHGNQVLGAQAIMKVIRNSRGETGATA